MLFKRLKSGILLPIREPQCKPLRNADILPKADLYNLGLVPCPRNCLNKKKYSPFSDLAIDFNSSKHAVTLKVAARDWALQSLFWRKKFRSEADLLCYINEEPRKGRPQGLGVSSWGQTRMYPIPVTSKSWISLLILC